MSGIQETQICPLFGKLREETRFFAISKYDSIPSGIDKPKDRNIN
jgi:hypothetical protein